MIFFWRLSWFPLWRVELRRGNDEGGEVRLMARVVRAAFYTWITRTRLASAADAHDIWFHEFAPGTPPEQIGQIRNAFTST